MAGTLTISTLSDGTNSTSATNCIQGSAKAWVNFNGTGTVAIRASYNVSSVTDNGTGDYTVNFTNAFSDANYSLGYMHKPTVAQSSEGNVRGCNIKYNVSPTTAACRIITQNGSSIEEYEIVSVSIFR